MKLKGVVLALALGIAAFPTAVWAEAADNGQPQAEGKPAGDDAGKDSQQKKEGEQAEKKEGEKKEGGSEPGCN